ncbi:MAG: tetratricopeptide repeat protein [Desulfobacterales bacterium]|nr:tetratricopeptide repeat protein [Desulfobacterales bacterium]
MSKKKNRHLPKEQATPKKGSLESNLIHRIEVGFIKPYVQLCIILIAVISIYGHTLDVPFYLDDNASIKENPAIINSKDISSTWHFEPRRVVPYVTFALNYRLHGFHLYGYHIVNILIHILNALLVWLLISDLKRTPNIIKCIYTQRVFVYLPFLTALLFAIHPLQTQAVTYIVQRLASLVTLWYVASVICYVRSRMSYKKLTASLWNSAAVIFFILAFFTKQNAVTLPLVIFLVEVMFFNDRYYRIFLFIVIMLMYALGWVMLCQILGKPIFSLNTLEALTREGSEASRLSYLATQMYVLWVYIRAFFWPVGLHLDYDISLSRGFGDPGIIFFFTGHILACLIAIFFYSKNRWLTFGILWYYITHLVESSLFPITDVCFEHRTYLPNIGLCLAISTGFFWIQDQFKFKRKTQSILIGLVIVFLVITWQRNQLWRDPIRFWNDCADHSPKKIRPKSELAKHYILNGKHTEALKLLMDIFKNSIQGANQGAALEKEDAFNLMLVLGELGQYETALKIADTFPESKLTPFFRSKLWGNRGYLYLKLNNKEKAEACYRKAVELSNINMDAMNNLGQLLLDKGNVEEACPLFRSILKIDSMHREANHNIKFCL